MGKHTQEQKWTADEDRLILLFANPNGRHKGFPNGKGRHSLQDWHGMEKKFEKKGYNRDWNQLRNRYGVICDQFERIDLGEPVRKDALERISALKAEFGVEGASSNVHNDIELLESYKKEEGLDDDVDVIMGFEKPVKHKSVRLKLKGAAIDEVGLFDAAMTPIELRPEEVQDVRTLGAAAEEQQLTRRLEGEGFDAWMDEDWKMEVEEGLRAGVDVREGVDGSPQECHIASMRKFAKELYDGGFLETDSLRRTRSGSVFA